MASIFSRFRNVRWYQWLLSALVLLYLIYIGVSYLYLPEKLKQVVETDVSRMIGRDIAVERLDYNPFDLSLTIRRFSVPDQPGKPLVKWERLYANISFWRSLFFREIALRELILDQPEVNIEKHPGRFNFSDILESLASEASPGKVVEEEQAEKKRRALEVFHVAINQGTFRFANLTGSTPARSDLDNLNIVLEHLYLATGDDHLSPFDIQALVPGGGKVRAHGRYRIDPLYIDAEVVGDNAQMSSFSGFVENAIPMKVSNGRLSFSTEVLLEMDTAFQLRADQGRLRITDLVLDDAVLDPPMMLAESISVDNVMLDLRGKNLTVEKIILDRIITEQWRDRAGGSRYENLFTGGAKEAKPEMIARPGTRTSGTPWTIQIKQVGLKDSTLNFSYQSETVIHRHALTDMTLDMENFSLAPSEQASIGFSAILDREGRIYADGAMTVSGFSLDLDCRLEELPLPLFSEYLESASFMGMEKGVLSVNGNISLGDAPFKAVLDLSIDTLQIKDTRTGDALVEIAFFKLEDVLVDAGLKKIAIGTISLKKPEIFAERSFEKEMNLAGLSKGRDANTESTTVSSESVESSDGSAWMYSVGKTVLQEGSFYYTDNSVTPSFTTEFQDMALTMDRIDAGESDPTPFSLTSKIDRYAPLTVTGTLSLLDQQPGFTFKSELDGLEMPGLSTYSGVYIGNNLKSGKLSLTLDYNLNGRKLKGRNRIIAENMYLGERVPGEPVIKAPVALGLALLRGLDGSIDLNVAVSGDLDDPGFSVSGIVIKALVNIIVKTAASPFKILGALVGGREDLGEITFPNGLSTLGSENQGRLEKLAEALTQKSQLMVRITGNASEIEDDDALRDLRVQERIAEIRRVSTAELQTEAAGNPLWMIPENHSALEKMNDGLGLPSAVERLSELQMQNPEAEAEGFLVDVYQQIYREVAEKEIIDIDDRLTLADRRALAIKQYLVDVLLFDHQRIAVEKSQKSALNGRTVALGLEVM